MEIYREHRNNCLTVKREKKLEATTPFIHIPPFYFNFVMLKNYKRMFSTTNDPSPVLRVGSKWS